MSINVLVMLGEIIITYLFELSIGEHKHKYGRLTTYLENKTRIHSFSTNKRNSVYPTESWKIGKKKKESTVNGKYKIRW